MMNEFESLIAMATVILALCVAMDQSGAALDAGNGGQAGDRSGSGVTQSLDLARHARSGFAASRGVLAPASMARLEDADRRTPAPTPRMHPPRQPGASR